MITYKYEVKRKSKQKIPSKWLNEKNHEKIWKSDRIRFRQESLKIWIDTMVDRSKS